MKVSSKTVTCLFCFMFIAELIGASLNCTTSCGNRGVDIRFPFWIKDRQPDQCGYPGFALSCNERGDIVLELPPAGKLHIEKIDYRNQVILASDPQRCLLRQHSNFNSSVFNLQFEKSKNFLLKTMSHYYLVPRCTTYLFRMIFVCLGPAPIVDLVKQQANNVY
ncbi:RING/U-BOX SUPERFAMILY PROTEIN [Salix koriyanagi]|uniref:RING-type E3 ubiquitin transferase n=1 Tax=Salix koriyanagi TaxID=2511006 RepID=A0A9Q0ZGP3_9ROSI|nr:RING/U-BOX SUPERFAMILY PROTEIN [Salix koriyanagi]